MTAYNTLSLQELVILIKNTDNNRAYDELINRLRPSLLQYGFVVLGDLGAAENIVALTFHHLWKFRSRLNVNQNIVQCLRQALFYKSIDFLIDNNRLEAFLYGIGEVNRNANSPIYSLP